jgi:hypothetical protein
MMRSAATHWTLVVLMALAISVPRSWAKRLAPKPVPPVVYRGTTYSVPNDNGRIGYIVASDSAGRNLFQIKIFETKIDPNLEEDVQWIFITELKLAGSRLIVTDEKSRCYTVELETNTVKHGC